MHTGACSKDKLPRTLGTPPAARLDTRQTPTPFSMPQHSTRAARASVTMSKRVMIAFSVHPHRLGATIL